MIQYFVPLLVWIILLFSVFILCFNEKLERNIQALLIGHWVLILYCLEYPHWSTIFFVTLKQDLVGNWLTLQSPISGSCVFRYQFLSGPKSHLTWHRSSGECMTFLHNICIYYICMENAVWISAVYPVLAWTFLLFFILYLYLLCILCICEIWPT